MVDRSQVMATQPAREEEPRWRELYILAAMRGLSFAGDIVVETSITLHLQSRGAGAYPVMALLLAATIPPIVLAPLTGRLADRWDSRKIIVVVALAQAVVCLAMTQWTSTAALVTLSGLLSAGLAFTQPIFAGLPGSMVGKAHIARASSISQATAMAGMVAAPGVGGYLTSQFGITTPILLNAASFAMVAIGGFAIKTRLHSGADPTDPTAGTEPDPSPYRVASDRFLRSLLVLSGSVMACASVINVLIVFYIRGTFGGSGEEFGLVVSAWMVGLIPGAVIVRKLKQVRHEAILLGSFLCIGLAILGVGLVPSAAYVIPFYILGGIGNGAQATVTHVLMNLRIPSTHRGRAFAALGAVSNTGPAVGFIAGGLILGIMTPRMGFIASGALVLISLIAFGSGVWRGSAPVIQDQE